MRVRCQGNAATLLIAEPKPGFEISDSTNRPTQIQVVFSSATHESDVRARCSPQGLVPNVKETGDDACVDGTDPAGSSVWGQPSSCALVLTPPGTAYAHPPGVQAAVDYRVTVAGVTPAAAGVTARFIDDGSRLELRSDSRTVEVLGYDGEPMLRVGPGGAWQNGNLRRCTSISPARRRGPARAPRRSRSGSRRPARCWCGGRITARSGTAALRRRSGPTPAGSIGCRIGRYGCASTPSRARSPAAPSGYHRPARAVGP